MGVCILEQCSLVLPVFKLYVNESYQMDSCISHASCVQHYPYEVHHVLGMSLEFIYLHCSIGLCYICTYMVGWLIH